MNKSDLEMKNDIEEELRWDPKVNAAQIGVSVSKGAVSLTGEVDTYPEKWAAEDATRRVGGVRAVAEDLTVKVLGPHAHSDLEIAEAALNALKWDVFVPKTVTATVHQGKISLEGQVEWNYQRESAERVVRYLAGVVGVSNLTTIKHRASALQVKDGVRAALKRQAKADAESIEVSASGGTVTLSGKASCRHAIEDASHAAWAAPGVTAVVDHVAISF